jgi:membrane protease YdiL (CAAX protease family)
MIATLAIDRPRPIIGRAVALTAGLAVAVVARAALNGTTAATAFLVGTVFGLGLLVLAAVAGWRVQRPTARALGVGLAGGLSLILLPVIARSEGGLPIGIHPGPFAAWVAVTAIVAIGEEVVLRGALFDALRPPVGVVATIGITSLAFALMHVPLYGWHVVPLDLAVGIWLAGLRLVSRSVAAPALAHTIADVATWWM